MIDFEDIKKYLPHYLTESSRKSLFEELEKFPDNIDSRFFTSYLKDNEIIYQGDGLDKLLFINLPDSRIDKMPAMILSNTCDISLENKRLFPKRIVYAPIFQLEKYRQLLIKNNPDSIESINSYVSAIKRQQVSDIIFLPKIENVINDSIVMLDRINNASLETVDFDNIKNIRFFSLSDYGFYILLIKISIHFTRIKEEVLRSH